MPNCLSHQMLVDFADGRLDAVTMARVEEHLDGCSSCFTLLAQAAREHGASSRPGLWPYFEDGRYELRGEHGRGGIGVVLRAFDHRLEREVALKLLVAQTADARARFAREATITARLQHPSVVAVYDVGRLPDGTLGYTMPFYPGRALREAISAQASLAGRLGLMRHVLAVTEAMAHAHARGVLHRDLKPANVLLGELGETVVIDWGLAIAHDAESPQADPEVAPLGDEASDGTNHTRTGAILGTPSYMPPEQARGERVDARADVYALGAILYHVIVSLPPFVGGPEPIVLQLAQGHAPRDVQAAQPDTPDDLAAVVRKAMARSPAHRYPDAGALADELRRWIDGGMVRAHAYTRGELLARWLRRHRALVYLAVAAFATLIGFGAIDFRRVRAERRIAQDNATSANARADALVLLQAEGALLTDPTRTLAWLKTYPESGSDWRQVRALSEDAERRGVARRVLRRNSLGSFALGVGSDGRRLFGIDGTSSVREWDVASGRSRALCLPEPLRGFDDASLGYPWLAVVGQGGAIHAVELASGTRDLVDVDPDAINVAISSNGRWVASGGETGRVHLWDRVRNRSLWLTTVDGPVESVSFLPDGAQLVVHSELGRLDLWDVERQELVYTTPLHIASRYWVGGRGHALVWATAQGLVWLDTWTLALDFMPAILELFNPIDFFADGRVLVGDRKRGTVVWDPRRRDSRAYPGLPGGTVAVSSNGRLIASAPPNGKVGVLDRETGDIMFFVGHHHDSVQRLGFLPGDQGLVSSDSDGNVRLWPIVLANEVIWRLDESGAQKPELAVRADGRLVVASAPDGTLWQRGLPDGIPVRIGQNHSRVKRMAFMPDGGSVILADAEGQLSRWYLADGRRELIARDLPGLQELQISPDGHLAAGMSFHQREAWVWNLRTGAARRLSADAGNYQGLYFSPDGRWLAVGASLDGVHGAGLYEVGSGRVAALEAAPFATQILGWTPSSRYVFGIDNDGIFHRFDVASGDHLQLPQREFFLWAVALTDELYLTSGSGRIALSIPSFGLTTTFDMESSDVVSFRRSPSRRRVLGSSVDNNVYVWELATGERHTLRGHDDTWLGAEWAGDDHIVSSAADGTVRIWTLPAAPPRTPRETLAWLETLTSERLGDERSVAPGCN